MLVCRPGLLTSADLAQVICFLLSAGSERLTKIFPIRLTKDGCPQCASREIKEF